MLGHTQALAIRRAGVVAAALAATVAAHHAATGHTGIHTAAPALWLGLVALGALVGSRTARFAPRHPLPTMALLLAWQVAAHAVMAHAPWALGLDAPASPVLGSIAFGAHAVAAVVLALILRALDDALALACGAARRLARLLTRTGPAASPRVPALAWHREPATAPVPHRCRPRGPPLTVVAT
jgi:hypothetical protein